MSVPFQPRVALASLSGRADADWAREAAPFAGAAFLGGISLDEPTREAARAMVTRDRDEFIPPDPFQFVDAQLADLSDEPIRAGVNVRAVSVAPIERTARICATHDAILEVNAHCRQDEMCAAGSGESLLRDTDRLAGLVEAADPAPVVSVKLRTEVDGVDLPTLGATLVEAGADILHVDAMDSESMIAEMAAAAGQAHVIANNEVRDRSSVREYLGFGANAVSVGRPSDDPRVLRRVRAAVDEWFDEQKTEPTAGEVESLHDGR